MGSLIGLIFGCGIALAISSLKKVGKDSKTIHIPEKYWPQFCDDLSAGIRAGQSISQATWQASESLPIFLQNCFWQSRKQWEQGATFAKSLHNLSLDLKSVSFSRIVHLIQTAQNQNASAVAALLSEFAQNLRADIALVNEIAGKQAVTRVSAKVAALAPIAVLLLTSSRSTVRNSYLTPTGLLVIAGAMTVTLFSYLMMRKISQIKVLSVG
ncbi:MAG: hypothetical protein NT032_07270 [Actinobacteria bacterium]|nr:hypothetical protein [Actinomycetota bacterium]